MNILNGTLRFTLVNDKGDMIWFSDTHEESLSYADTLIRHKKEVSIFSICQSWNTYGKLWENVKGTEQRLY